MRHRFLLAAAFVYLVAANLIWIARDTRPPFWDMALHQTGALRIYDAFAGQGMGAVLVAPLLTGSYPPLYHSVVAAFYALFGRTVDAAQWANIPAIALLFLATYGLGRTLLGPMAAAAAAMLANFYPFLLWLSRETLIDYWLTSMVALSVWLLVRTNEFSDRRRCIEFGLACGLGMLTKWTFGLFLAGPVLWSARKNPKNAAIAAAIAASVAGYWYANMGRLLLEFLKINNSGAANEGDPSRLSFGALTFYVRALEGYQLFFVLFIAFIAGAVVLAKNFNRAWTPIVLWIGGGWLTLLLFQNKDPRYSAPLLPAVALITACIFRKRQSLILLLAPLLVFQHYLVSFGIPQLPSSIVIAKGIEGPLSWQWNLYTQRYFDLWGPPAAEDWRIRHVLDQVSASGKRPVRVGMIPDIPRFDSQAFQFYITLWRLPVIIDRIVTMNPSALANEDYIVVSEKDRGFEPGSFFTEDLKNINHYVLGRADAFQLVEMFSLPNGDVIRLYKARRL